MKVPSFLVYIYRKLFRSEIPGLMQLIRQQEQLLQEGIETSGEVIDTPGYAATVVNVHSANLWVKIKKPDGSYLYTHTQSIVPPHLLPGKGQHIRLKYSPGNLSSILILAIISK